jgi:alkyl sulfatase BDS1-like metallo-beta-lactamase superfamily hydrolase
MPAEGASPPQHFDKLGKPPSTFTLELRNGLKAKLPFDDKRDYDEAKRGFIAEPPYTKIMADAGARRLGHGELRLASRRQGLREHQSLAAAAGGAQHAYGLYEVVPDRIYQVRGYDLSNISFTKGNTGWIIFDPLTAKETARAALEFVNDKPGAVRWWASSTRIRTSTTWRRARGG